MASEGLKSDLWGVALHVGQGLSEQPVRRGPACGTGDPWAALLLYGTGSVKKRDWRLLLEDLEGHSAQEEGDVFTSVLQGQTLGLNV